MNKLFQTFVSKWVSTYHGNPVPESEESLKRLEVTYSFTLPKSYIDFLSTVGSVYTPEILDSVVEIESELESLQDIYSVEAAIEMTNGWQGVGMPKNLFAFANDAMGNKFCFDMKQCVSPRCSDLPVYFFDHDFGTTDVVTNSFLEFLESYVELEKAED
jgi:hypothetical protein